MKYEDGYIIIEKNDDISDVKFTIAEKLTKRVRHTPFDYLRRTQYVRVTYGDKEFDFKMLYLGDDHKSYKTRVNSTTYHKFHYGFGNVMYEEDCNDKLPLVIEIAFEEFGL